jgi:hypothetical protein
MPEDGLSAEDRRILWEQFVEVHGDSQKSYDTSVRILAAAGSATTASLATALHRLDGAGAGAFTLFLVSLGLNFVSYATAQGDMHGRLKSLRKHSTLYPPRNSWTTATDVLNVLAGGTLIAGGALLGLFVSWST